MFSPDSEKMKIALKILTFIIAGLILLALIPYLFTPVYDFPERHVFSGDKLYNPYESILPGKWLKANFHAHSNAWYGFTNGRENISEEMKERYSSLGYDIISISDYMKINSSLKGEKTYVPVYEHGYGFTKNHQLVIGAGEVDWLDYVFIQNINDKQRTLKQIKKDYNIVVLNHPHLRDAYSTDDVIRLTDFDFIEIINQNYGSAFDLWDEALSAGNPVFGIADDDSHNSKNYYDIGKCFSFVNADSSTALEIINALRQGRNISVDLSLEYGQFDTLKNNGNKQFLPKEFKVSGSTISLKLGNEAKEIIFIGQNGKRVSAFSDADSAYYSFLPGDTYIRTEIVNFNGSRFFLNPVIRIGDTGLQQYSSAVNQAATFIFRLIIICLIAITAATVVLLIKKKNKKILANVSTAGL
jgi:hypothetical protein